ncbi:MAG: C10 family peptidase [Bacteroidales bacterium]|nr:C10 family peptidase [Bacteroidales bacterium]
MKRLYPILIFLALAIAPALTLAGPVSEPAARAVAARFLGLDSRQLTTVKAPADYPFYVFGTNNSFVIVAADDCVYPILAYSRTTAFSFDRQPANIESWLADYAAQINGLVENDIQPTDEIAAQWQGQIQRPLSTSQSAMVEPLLHTTWSQSPLYNDSCPAEGTDHPRHAVTGCVATAMAQIMKYWNHPATGWGSADYYHHTFGYLSANFGATTYNWDSMPDFLDYGVSSPNAIAAVATLMYHCGVAVAMDYSVSISGAYTYSIYNRQAEPNSLTAMQTYFRYSSKMSVLFRDDYTNGEWLDNFYREIDAGRPILHTGSNPEGGHAFVCDGYDSTGLFHINWGWGGYCDGYYRVGALNPASGGTGGTSISTYNNNNAILVGIEPDTVVHGSTTTVTVQSNNAAYGRVTGSGSYTTYVDTVKLVAIANDGYRFVSWKDGSHVNPRTLVATDDFTDTAIFAPISGDTLGYGNGYHAFSVGGSREIWWAIKLLPSAFGDNRELTQVRVYLPQSGQYGLKVYRGGVSAPGGQVLTQSVIANEGEVWYNIPLIYPVDLSYNMPIWIVMSSNSVDYPVAATHYSGNSDGSWISWNGTNAWEVSDYVNSWMMYAILSDTTADYNVSAVANHTSRGTVSGGGTYHYGTSTRLQATPADGYRFESWSDGTALNPRNVVVTGNVNYVANFMPRNFMVEVSSSNAAYGSVGGGGVYAYGSMATVTATPNTNITFSHWSDGSTDNPYTFQVTQDVSLRAYFDNPNAIEQPDGTRLTVTITGRTVNLSAPATLYDAAGRLIGGPQCSFTVPSAGVYMLVVEGGKPHKIVIM